ncbi:MAG TPA: ribosome maturation factor RimM [Gammaproteobacteria bacterium]|nr:ribosome maturation factor RimM [Gammaproteobacteria bacterium]
MSAQTSKLVILGRVSGIHGVKGWIKVHSYTEPRGNITGYSAWLLQRDGRDWAVEVEDGRAGGRSVFAKLRGIDDRDQASECVGAKIAVERSRLPPCAPGEYYWADLEGLEVRNVEGELLGRVDHVLATGGPDVLVLAGNEQRMIPFVMGQVIRNVDLGAGLIVADWAADF